MKLESGAHNVRGAFINPCLSFSPRCPTESPGLSFLLLREVVASKAEVCSTGGQATMPMADRSTQQFLPALIWTNYHKNSGC